MGQAAGEARFARKVGLGFVAIGSSVLAIAVVSMLLLVLTVRDKDARALRLLRQRIAVHELASDAEQKIAVARAHRLSGDRLYGDDVERTRHAFLEQLEAVTRDAGRDERSILDDVALKEWEHREASRLRRSDDEIDAKAGALRDAVHALIAHTDSAHEKVEAEARALNRRALMLIAAAMVIGLAAAAWLARWLARRLIDLYRAEKRAVLRQEAASGELQLIIDALPVMVSSIGPDGRYRFVNRSYAEWLSKDRAEVVGRDFREVFHPPHAIAAAIQRGLAGLPAHYDAQINRASDGQSREVQGTIVPRHRHGGEPDGTVTVIEDVTEERRARTRERVLAEVTRRLGESTELETRLRQTLGLVVPAVATGASIELALPGEPALRVAAGRTGDAVTLPLTAHGEVLGSLELVLPAEDAPFAEELARRLAMAAESAKLTRATKRALAARDEMLAVVSHDLRNPLGVILLKVEELQRLVSDPRKRRHLESIEKAADRMESLIKSLLDVSRIESGRLVLERRPSVPHELLDEAVQLFEPLATEKSILLSVEAKLAPLVFADRQRVLQVLENLIGNAIKFSPTGSKVQLKLERGREGFVFFSVQDNGPGVKEADRLRIFERWFQGERKRRKGLGLGLYIARAIVETHGGRIWVEPAEGGGACFCFELPEADASSLGIEDEAARSPDVL